MNIFKLFGSIFVDSSEAEKSISSTDNKANNLAQSFLSGAKTVGKWGVAIGAAAASAAVAVGTLAVKTSDAANKAMNDFGAKTGLTTEQLGKYKEVMKSIYGNNFGESFEDIAQAMAQIKQQAGDIGAEEMESLTTNALMLRDTFEFEVSESMRAAKMMMDQFGMSGEEAYNLIAQGAQSGLDKNGDLLDSINEYSVHFNQLGFSAEEMFNMLANGTKAGTFSVDKLGDAIKEFGIRVKDGSDGSREAFEALGYDADTLFQTFNEGGEEAATMTQELIDKLASMPDSVEKTTIGVALFGTMWEDLGAEGIKALSEIDGAISTTHDALEQINSVKYNSLGEAFEGLKRQLETSILMPLGDKLIPVVEFAIEKVAGLGSVAQKFGEWISGIGVDVQGTSDIMSAFEQIANAAFQGVWEFAQTVWNSIGKPIWDLITYSISETVEAFQEKLPAMQAFCQEAFDGISDTWENHLKPVFEAIGTLLNEYLLPAFQFVFSVYVLPLIQNTFGTIADLWNHTLKPVFDGICDFLLGVFTNDWKLSLQGILNIVIGAFNAIRIAVEKPMDLVKDIVNNAIEFIKEKFNFDWKFPKLKLPHFRINGSFSLDPPSVPTFGIEWYKNGGVMMKPTAFGINPANGKMMVGGEAGAEAIAPIAVLQKYIQEAVGANDMQIVEAINEGFNQLINLLLQYIPQLSNMQLVMDTGVVVGELAPEMDVALGKLAIRNKRGV